MRKLSGVCRQSDGRLVQRVRPGGADSVSVLIVSPSAAAG